MKKNIVIKKYLSPCGELLIGDFEGKLCMCDWLQSRRRDVTDRRLNRLLNAGFISGTTEIIERAILQLEEYFAGKRRYFDMPILTVGTDFQKKVWQSLMSIDIGQTVSYSSIAELIGMPSGTRAVANAIGANALSIFVPCHRVVGKSGNLTGYAGGIEAKKCLIDVESKIVS